ncbi:MAG: hypothetical protein HY329_17640 [Chloroflexi bacterium]|nr:hypothetical protein [Chloroflexota bacterium]
MFVVVCALLGLAVACLVSIVLQDTHELTGNAAVGMFGAALFGAGMPEFDTFSASLAVFGAAALVVLYRALPDQAAATVQPAQLHQSDRR